MIKTSIKVSGSEEDDSILDFFFPNFVLTLRDVTLEGHEDGDNAFLEDKLKLKDLSAKKRESLKEFNLPRTLIRRYFKKRTCFRFRMPVEDSLLSKLMALQESDLKPEFQKKLSEFRDYVLSCRPKALKSGKAINGRMFGSLLVNYVDSIQANEAPCLTSAMISMAADENKHAVMKATDVYNKEMKRRLACYTPSDKGLENYHKDSMQVALEVLKSGLIIDDEQIYEEKALVCFKTHFEDFKKRVKKVPEEKCQIILNRLNTMKIQVKIKNRKYCIPTGYDDYMKDIDSLTQQFFREAGHMGSVARIALRNFLDGKVGEEELVYEMVMEAEGMQGEGPQRRLVTLYTTYREEDERIIKEEEDLEKAVEADIQMFQENGLLKIGQQYLDMLKTKTEEVERVKKELTTDSSYYLQLCRETTHWNDVYNKAALNMQRVGESADRNDVSVTTLGSFDHEENVSLQKLQGMNDDTVHCDEVGGRRKDELQKCDIL